MSLVLSIFSQDILLIFVVAGIGFLLARRFGANVKALSTVAFNALSPCLAALPLRLDRATLSSFLLVVMSNT